MTAVSVDIHCDVCLSSSTLGSIVLHAGEVVLLLLGGPAALGVAKVLVVCGGVDGNFLGCPSFCFGTFTGGFLNNVFLSVFELCIPTSCTFVFRVELMKSTLLFLCIDEGVK